LLEGKKGGGKGIKAGPLEGLTIGTTRKEKNGNTEKGRGERGEGDIRLPQMKQRWSPFSRKRKKKRGKGEKKGGKKGGNRSLARITVPNKKTEKNPWNRDSLLMNFSQGGEARRKGSQKEERPGCWFQSKTRGKGKGEGGGKKGNSNWGGVNNNALKS